MGIQIQGDLYALYRITKGDLLFLYIFQQYDLIPILRSIDRCL